MDLSKWLNDERLLANLIGIHLVLAAILIVSIILRKALKSCSEQVARWTGLHWLDDASKEAGKSMRLILFWCTIVLMVGSIVSIAVYHLSGRHAHDDFKDWCAQLTSEHLKSFGLMLGKLVLLALGVAVAFRVIRRLRVFLEIQVHHHLPKVVHPDATNEPEALATEAPSQERRQHLEETIRRW